MNNQKHLNYIDRYIKNAPKGCLKTQKKSGKTYYYHQYTDLQTTKEIRKYIKKENDNLVKKLAQKGYFLHLRPVLLKNLHTLQEFQKKFDDESVDKIYDELDECKKSLISPISVSVKEKLKQWNCEEYAQNNNYPEMLKYETEKGELVRSKSELIIANMLFKNGKDILYKYERPLNVIIDGKEEIIYPDFTIINVHTGKITYWEHVGCLDDTKYANGFVKKMNTYINNQIFPGEDLVCTYESSKNSLEISVVKNVLEKIL